MEDSERIKVHNMGVVDIDGLNSKGYAEHNSFSIAEVRANNKEWGPPQPRPTVKYAISRSIELPRLGEVLAEFSISHRSGHSIRNLRDTISDYVFEVESAKHLFCIHRRPNPEFYYDRTVLSIPGRSVQRRSAFPCVLIVSDSEDDANYAFEHLCREQRKLKCRRPGVQLLNENSNFVNLNTAGVMIGSVHSIFRWLNFLTVERRGHELQKSLKFVIINNAEKIILIPQLNSFLYKISEFSETSRIKMLFMYGFAATQTAPLLDVIRSCQTVTSSEMFIEVDKPRERNFIKQVKFLLATPAEDYANEKAAQAFSKGKSLPDELLALYTTVMTPHAQKLNFCYMLIEKLRNERERFNMNRANKRRERILIVTKNSKVATTVTMYLKERYLKKVSANGQRKGFSVNCILTQDSVENVEKRNFEFRHGSLDVLVINWKSINDVLRGTVDAVIIFDSAHPRYFQTMMETEMDNLTSMNCVKLKLYIIIDQQADKHMLPQYVKFLQKYKHQAPQWFRAQYEKYRTEFNANLAERNRLISERPLTNSTTDTSQ
ncbi:hypothetical protein L3Y34_009029 [Caenorhabditis briggsae]|uniref:Uncharacterized protein n=1 Tax=Caenorhabditis briggsae TaxID=6238 RepID=A0AAE9A4B1_CAEBR|nr:hypothetical protein L3Y34_009029 [Caenorhabditis briggsae]